MLKIDVISILTVLLWNKRVIPQILMNISPHRTLISKLMQYNILLGTIFTNNHGITLYNLG